MRRGWSFFLHKAMEWVLTRFPWTPKFSGLPMGDPGSLVVVVMVPIDDFISGELVSRKLVLGGDSGSRSYSHSHGSV